MLLHAMTYTILLTTGDTLLSPLLLIKKRWASHTLKTRSYANMCKHLVPGGCTIHHSQQKQPTSETLTWRITKTASAYLKVFGALPPATVWSNLARFLPSQAQPGTTSEANDGQQSTRLIPIKNYSDPHQSFNNSMCLNAKLHMKTPNPVHATSTANVEIFLKALDGNTISFNVNADWTVYFFQYLIFKSTEIPCNQQKRIYAGRQLEDARSLCDYNILHKCTIHMVMMLRGC